MTEHLWLCEHYEIRTGVSWGHCSCGWAAKGTYQRQKPAWLKHVAAAQRKVLPPPTAKEP